MSEPAEHLAAPSPTVTASSVSSGEAGGQTAEAAHDRDRAVRACSFVLDAWRGGEPPVRCYVEEAREGLQRLTGEKGGSHP